MIPVIIQEPITWEMKIHTLLILKMQNLNYQIVIGLKWGIMNK